MPKRFRRKRKSKFITKRALPFLLMKNAEPKFHELDFTDLVAPGTPTNLDLTFIAQGDSQNERIGQSIQATGVYFRAVLGVTANVDGPIYVRYILYTKRNNATADLNVTGPSIPDFDQYIIWADKLMPCPWTNNISNSVTTIRKKFKPFMKVMYNGSGAGSVEKGNLHLMMTVNTDEVNINYAVRLYYRDL